MQLNYLKTKRNKSNDSVERKARTRTLIQIGGLVDKAGLLELFDIETGDDLEQDIKSLNKAATLLGFLIDTIDNNNIDDKTKQKWFRTGLIALKGTR